MEETRLLLSSICYTFPSSINKLYILDESTSQMSHWDRLQQIIKSVYQNHQSVQASVDHSDKYFDENYCADRCVIHPSNRYTCGKARSAEHCSTVGCCWDENSQHCYKEACKSISSSNRTSK